MSMMPLELKSRDIKVPTGIPWLPLAYPASQEMVVLTMMLVVLLVVIVVVRAEGGVVVAINVTVVTIVVVGTVPVEAGL